LMWTPAAASVVARLALHDGFGDVSFRLGGRRGSKAMGLALIFPVVIGLIAYGIAWTTDLVQFSPRPNRLTAPYIATKTAFSFVFARLRLETGSVWPAITLHSAWNAIIQTAFDPASHGAQPELWIGESGILTALTMIVAAIAFSYGRWTILRTPE